MSDLDNINPIGMLYQTGYLTIADYSQGLYQLRVPDEEVKRDIAALVAGAWAGRDAQWSASLGVKLRAGKWGDFFEGLKALYAKLPYGSRESVERKNEFSYQRPLCALLAAQGFRYDPEVTQTAGRSDLIAEHPSGVWIFELKVNETSEAALAQIKAKDYAAPYRARNLPHRYRRFGVDPSLCRHKHPVSGRLISVRGACRRRHKNGILLTAKSVNKLSGSANERFGYKTRLLC